MRILAFYPYVPYPLDRGAYYRAYHLLRELARDHEVDLLALSENGDGTAHKHVFAEFCHRVEFVPFQHPAWPKLFPKRLLNPIPATAAHWTLPHAVKTLSRMIHTERYHAVHILDIILAQYFLDDHRSLPLVTDRTRVDLQYQLMERERMRASFKTRLLNLENLAKLWRYERRVAARARLEIVCGPDDERFVRRYISKSVETVVIPNGVDTAYFHPEAILGEARSVHPTVLFCGAMDYNPNLDALRWYFAEIHDALVQLCPGLRVLIVGKNPGPEIRAAGTRPNVVVTGAVPDVRPYYQRAWLQIVPLRIGGGTRLKIVESLAMGTPVVSTSIGAQGLDLRHNREILLADTAADFAGQTARALREPGLRAALESAGLDTIRSRLCWPTLGRHLSWVYTHRFDCGPSGGSGGCAPFMHTQQPVSFGERDSKLDPAVANKEPR